MAMRFDEVPLWAWKASIKKWTKCLLDGESDWTCCAVCGVVWNKHQTSDCTELCPLSVSKWCVADQRWSKLSKVFVPYVGCKDFDSWETRVSNYLWWLTLEVEAAERWQ